MGANFIFQAFQICFVNDRGQLGLQPIWNVVCAYDTMVFSDWLVARQVVNITLVVAGNVADSSPLLLPRRWRVNRDLGGLTPFPRRQSHRVQSNQFILTAEGVDNHSRRFLQQCFHQHRGQRILGVTQKSTKPVCCCLIPRAAWTS